MKHITAEKRNRILNLLIPLLLIAGLLLSSHLFQLNTVNDTKAQAYAIMRDSVAEQAAVFRTSVDGRFMLLNAFSMELGEEEEYQTEEQTLKLQKRMTRIVDATGFISLAVANTEGVAISNDGASFNVSDAEFFKTAINGERHLSILSTSFTEQRIFSFSLPVMTNGTPTGMLFGACSDSELVELMAPEAYSESVYSFVTDASGGFITGTEGAYAALPDEAELKAYIQSGAYESAEQFLQYFISSSPGVTNYAICVPLEINGWYLFNVIDPAKIESFISKQLNLSYAASVVTLMLSGAFLLYYISVNRRKNKQLAGEKERLRRSEELYRALEGFTDGIVFEGDVALDTLKFNQSYYDKLGRYPDICKLSEVSKPNMFISEADSAAWASFGRDLKNGVPTSSCEVRISNTSGVYSWYRITYTLIYDESGKPCRLVGKLSDIDKSKRSLQQLITQAETDSLTGVLNHEATRAHVNDFLNAAGKDGTHAFFIVDLDNFKKVNDIFGHFEGDRMLIKLTNELKNVFRSTDIIGRIGGDEFVILVKNIANDNLLRLKAAELCEMLQFTHTATDGGSSVDKDELSITSSVGVSRYTPGSGCDFDILYKKADEALYIAKGRGKSRYVLHEDVLESESDSSEMSNSGDEPTSTYTRNANIQLRTLLEHMDGGVLLIEVGSKLRALYISPGFYTMTYTTSEHAKKYANDILMLINQEDRAQFESNLRSCAASGKTVDVVYRGVEWRGRSSSWWHLRGGLIDYEDSTNPVLAAVVTDVTKLKSASEELRLSKLRLNLAFEQTNMVICELDIQKREFRAWNIKDESYFDEATMDNAPMPAIADMRIHPDSAAEAQAFFERIYDGETEGSTVLKLRNLTDVYGWYKVSFKSMLSDDGTPLKAVGIIESVPAIADIKSRFEREESFAAEFSYLMLATSKFNLTRNRLELLWSADRRLYGTTRVATYDDLCAVVGTLMIDSDEQAQAAERFSHQALIKAFERGAQAIGEYRYTRLDGSLSWANLRVNLMLDPMTGDLYGFGYFRDVKKRKELENELTGPVTRDSTTGAYAEHTARSFTDTVLKAFANKDDFCGMLIISLFGFGPAKEQMGYHTADQLLLLIARLLCVRFDSENIVGRLGDDNFTVFFPSIQSSEWLEDMADEVLSMLDASGIENMLPAAVTYSLGGALAKVSDATYERLVTLSRQSIEATKKQKRKRYTINVGIDF